MATHVKVVAVIFIVLGAFGILGAIFSSVLFGVLAGLVGATDEQGARIGGAFLGLTGAFLSVVILIMSLPSLVCGWGLFKLRPWARIVGIILAAMGLISFPWGTFLGIYILWVLFQKNTEALFQAA
jgi:hypothetical protein